MSRESRPSRLNRRVQVLSLFLPCFFLGASLRADSFEVSIEAARQNLSQGDFSAAERNLQRAARRAGNLNQSHQDLPRENLILASYLVEAGQSEDAWRISQRAYRQARLVFDPGHLAAFEPYQTLLGRLYLLRGLAAPAADMLSRSLRVLESQLAPNHPDLLEVVRLLSTAYRRSGASQEALFLEERFQGYLGRRSPPPAPIQSPRAPTSGAAAQLAQTARSQAAPPAPPRLSQQEALQIGTGLKLWIERLAPSRRAVQRHLDWLREKSRALGRRTSRGTRTKIRLQAQERGHHLAVLSTLLGHVETLEERGRGAPPVERYLEVHRRDLEGYQELLETATQELQNVLQRSAG